MPKCLFVCDYSKDVAKQIVDGLAKHLQCTIVEDESFCNRTIENTLYLLEKNKSDVEFVSNYIYPSVLLQIKDFCLCNLKIGNSIVVNTNLNGWQNNNYYFDDFAKMADVIFVCGKTNQNYINGRNIIFEYNENTFSKDMVKLLNSIEKD